MSLAEWVGLVVVPDPREMSEEEYEAQHRQRQFQTSMSDLPDDVLLHIFSYLNFIDLSMAGRVCRRWYALTHDFTLHRQVDLSSVQLTPKQLQSLFHLETMPSVENLHVFGSHNCLWLKNISPKSVAKIGKRCPKLRYLRIENFSFRSSSKNKCVRLIDFPSTLEVLSLRGSIIGRGSFFKVKSEKSRVLKHLEVLDLGRCFFVADAEVKPFPRLPRLSELYLEGCPFIDSLAYLTDLLSKCPRLTLLDIEGTYVVENALNIIAAHCPFIEHLYLGCTPLTDAVALQLPRRAFHDILDLCIVQTAVTDEGLTYLAHALPSLALLRCDRRYLSEQAIAQAAADEQPARHFSLRVEVVPFNLTSASFRHEGCGHFLNNDPLPLD